MVFQHMATSQPQPSAGGEPARAVSPPGEAARALEGRSGEGSSLEGRSLEGLVPAAPADGEPEEEEVRLASPVARLPVELDVMVPVREFRVRHLLALTPGQLIESRWGHGEDVPVAAGDVQLAWSEFEVIDTQLAVRITRLA
jgi:flagellar motor switch/type III secretory pathway protein FliN